jgi:pimeloyl-ACP methyl ester carboxylesterase
MKIQSVIQTSHKVVQVGNSQVSYQVLGDGEPLILVHGLSGSMRWWVRNVQEFAQHHRVYLVDLPRFGTMRRMRTRFALVNVA